MNCRLLLFIPPLLLVSTICFGQAMLDKVMPKPVPKSPNAAAMDRFGDYQVSHFTGLPNISIPIYEAKSGALSVPITLSYHAAGNKPLDIASWVGLGWSINTGGQLTRNVNGRPDEDYYFTHALHPNPNSCTSYEYLENMANGVFDSEPDVFNYSYPGGSGKFILVNSSSYVSPQTPSPLGPAYLFPYAPILVSRLSDQKFELTDDKGIIYRYGTSSTGATSTEFTQAFNGGNPTLQATTGWNLMDIVSPNSADKINYTYQNVGTASRHDVVHTWLVTDLCTTTGSYPCPPSTHTVPQSPRNTDSNVNQQGVDEIQFDNGKVKFILSGSRSDISTLKSLDRIEVYELFGGTSTLIKTIKFNYGYFTHGGGGSAALKLNSVQVKDAANSVVQTYTFTYHSDTFSWNPASANFYSARDFWGFYNGASNSDLVLNQSIIYQANAGGSPVVPNPTIGGATNRSVNTAYSKEGVLRRIDFPTGGFTEFEFENHKYLNEASVVTNAGGLRVTTITSKESANAVPMLRTYRYGLNESGTGRALFTSNQLNYFSEQWISSNCEVAGSVVNRRIRSYQSTFFNVDESSPVVYPYVAEYQGDPAGVHNGKAVYEYDAGFIPADMDQYVPSSTKVFKNSYAWQRGKLTQKTVFDRNANKLREEVYQFSTYKADSKLVGIGVHWFRQYELFCFDAGFCMNELGQSVSPNTFQHWTFTQSSGVMLPSLSIVRTFENGNINNVITTTQSNTYHADKLALIQTSVSRSNTNEETVTVNVYPFQFAASVNASSTGNAKGIYMLNMKNVLSTPIETYTFLQGPGATNQRVISAVLTTFRGNTNNANHVVADQVFLFESAQPILRSNFVPMTVTSSAVAKDMRYVLRLNFNEYDANSQIVQFAKAKDIPNSFQYGYSGKLPVAEIKNASVLEFKHEGFEDSSVAGVVLDAAAAQTGRKYFNGDYTISFTPPNTRSYVIEYYYFSSPNWVFIRKPYTGTSMLLSEGTRIDNIRIRPADAPMTTYTYNPMYGMSSATDPNCVTTFYGYDTFGRLQIVKDHNNNALSTYDYHYYKQ